MSLISGKRVHGYKWVELPIDKDVIERVNELAHLEKQPELIHGNVHFEWGMNAANVSNKRNADDDVNILTENETVVESE